MPTNLPFKAGVFDVPDSYSDDVEFEQFLAGIKTAALAGMWINEMTLLKPDEDIKHFLGPLIGVQVLSEEGRKAVYEKAACSYFCCASGGCDMRTVICSYFVRALVFMVVTIVVPAFSVVGVAPDSGEGGGERFVIAIYMLFLNDTSNNRVIATIPVGSGPWGVAINHDP